MKPRIVLSGVNFTEMGPLTVFKEALTSLSVGYSDQYEIVALVHRKALFDIPGVIYMEYPAIKSSWLKRLHFEYFGCRGISETLKPYLWLAMHDMTPDVKAKIRAVYCHNPAPFYPFKIREALHDWKFGCFTLLYRFLYSINIKSNDFVVVQQAWLRDKFISLYGVNNVVVAHPSVERPSIANTSKRADSIYRFFYPSYPRTFKNLELLLKAVLRLEELGFTNFELWLTMDGTETPYAANLVRDYVGLRSVRWFGLLPREEVLERYSEADCLVFPSKLETWGMPITEFKATGKPILAADLPYAHETVGTYERVGFFDTESDADLAALMERAISGDVFFSPAVAAEIAPPFSRDWPGLWQLLLSGDD